MSNKCKALLLVTALIATSADAGSTPTAEQIAAMSNEQLYTALNDGSNPLEDACRTAPLADELVRRLPSNQNVGFAAMRRGLCASMQRRPVDAVREFELAEGLGSGGVRPEARRALDFLLTLSARAAENWSALEEHALHIAVRDDAAEFADLEFENWRYLFYNLPKAEAGRISLAMARAEAFPSLPEKLQSMLAYRAVKPAMAEGDMALAVQLATREPSPQSLLELLIDRSYESIWPQLAEHAGSNLSKELDANLAKAMQGVADMPEDVEKLSALVHAHLWLRQYDQALAAAARIDHSPAAFNAMGEHHGWLIDSEVMALDALGRSAEADALFDRLAALDPRDRGWLVNFVINRADRLVQQGRWAEALPAAELAVEVAATQGSPYAKEVAAADRYCAAVKIDPARTELANWWTEIESGRLENVGSAVQAAQCRGDLLAARRFLREGLENEDSRAQALRLLQTRAFSLFRDERNMFAEPRLLMDGDPALQAVFRRYGRVLPSGLEPR